MKIGKFLFFPGGKHIPVFWKKTVSPAVDGYITHIFCFCINLILLKAADFTQKSKSIPISNEIFILKARGIGNHDPQL